MLISGRALSSPCLPETFLRVFNPGWNHFNISFINFFVCSIADDAICVAPFKLYPKVGMRIKISTLPASTAWGRTTKLCVCDLEPLSTGVFVQHSRIWKRKKRERLVNTVIYEMQLASGNNKKSVQRRCASIGNQYSPRMMIPTCNKLYWFWTSSRLFFCSVRVVFLFGRYEDAWGEPYISASDQAVAIVKVSEKMKGRGFLCLFLFFVFSQCSQFLMGDQVNIMKAWKSSSALCVTSRPPCLILSERLQQKESLW